MFFTYTAATSDQFIPRHVTPTCPRVTALVESSSSYAVYNNNTMVCPFLRTFSLDPTKDFPIHRYPISVRALQLPVPLARHPPAHLYLHVHPRGRTTAH